LRLQRGCEVRTHLAPQSRLHKRQHRRRQQEYDSEHGDEKFRPKMFEGA
jgi:hypothetical protein